MLAEGTDRFADEFGHLSLKIGFAQLAGEAVREYFVERQPWARRQGKAGTKGIVIGAGEEIPQPFGQSSGVEPIFVDQQRSEERRVGKECVSTCISRWSPYP